MVSLHTEAEGRQAGKMNSEPLVKNLPAVRESWVGKIPWRRERLPTSVCWPGEFHGLYSPGGSQRVGHD